MQSWLDHPAVQAGALPFFAALALVVAARRLRLAWLAPTVAYAIAVVLTTGIAFTPLTAGRKVLLLTLLAPLLGLAVDRLDGRASRALACVAAGAATAWALSTVFVQRPPVAALALAVALGTFAAAIVALALRLRDDAAAVAATGLGLGLATGVGALLSASTGYFTAGVATAAGAGALLVVGFATGANSRPGATGALVVALPAALFAAATLMLAQLPWTALVLMLAVPALGAVPLPSRLGPRARIAARTLVAFAAAALPIAASWLATRAAAT